VNPLYWRLIKEFGDRTGVPVVMNTSFNLRGETNRLRPHRRRAHVLQLRHGRANYRCFVVEK
jgi:hypothetical protein